MMSRAEIESAWNAHYFRPFPRECAGTVVDGVCLTSCDTFLAGCISNFVENGTLDLERTDAVASVCADLERVMPRLSGEARAYFSELLALGKALEVRANAR
jgi:hypothetical protein